jgi:hypothetical protein
MARLLLYLARPWAFVRHDQPIRYHASGQKAADQLKIRLSVPASGRRLRKLLRQVANRRQRISVDWVGQVALQQSIVAQGC